MGSRTFNAPNEMNIAPSTTVVNKSDFVWNTDVLYDGSSASSANVDVRAIGSLVVFQLQVRLKSSLNSSEIQICGIPKAIKPFAFSRFVATTPTYDGNKNAAGLGQPYVRYGGLSPNSSATVPSEGGHIYFNNAKNFGSDNPWFYAIIIYFRDLSA